MNAIEKVLFVLQVNLCLFFVLYGLYAIEKVLFVLQVSQSTAWHTMALTALSITILSLPPVVLRRESFGG